MDKYNSIFIYTIINSFVTYNYSSMNTRVDLQLYVFITYNWNYHVNYYNK